MAHCVDPVDRRVQQMIEKERNQRRKEACFHSHDKTLAKDRSVIDSALSRRNALKCMVGGIGVTLSTIALNQSPALHFVTDLTCPVPTYTIQQVGNTTTATPAAGCGLKPISGSDAAAVIMHACIRNSSVLIKAGTYVISNKYGLNIKSNNVELYGDSSLSTVLKLANGMNNDVINLQYGNSINLHDLQIDGNRINQSQNPGYPAINAYGFRLEHNQPHYSELSCS